VPGSTAATLPWASAELHGNEAWSAAQKCPCWGWHLTTTKSLCTLHQAQAPPHPDQVKQKKRGASIACPAFSRIPRSQPVPVYFHSPEATFMPEEQREALELHIGGKKVQTLEGCLGMKRPSQSAVPQEEGGRAALRTSALPSTPCKATTKQPPGTAGLCPTAAQPPSVLGRRQAAVPVNWGRLHCP